MRLLFVSALLAFGLLQSCTVVTSTNFPGKAESKFPKMMTGRFELNYPGDLAALSEGAKTTVEFTATKMMLTTDDSVSETILGDSVFISKLGKSYYFALGAAPSFTVFKVVKAGKDLHFFSMCPDATVEKSTFEPYFTKVTEIPGEPDDETGEPGPPSYEVTIDDKKIESYFKSDVPSKDPFILKRTK